MRIPPVVIAALAATTLIAGCSSAQPTTGSTAGATAAAGAVESSVGAQDALALATAANAPDHDDADDHVWDDADVVDVTLTGDTADVDDPGVVVEGSTVTVVAAGTYRLSGTLDGQVVVNSPADGLVRLILDGADVVGADGPAIAVIDADEVQVVLATGSDNSLADADEYALTEDESGVPTAALASAADLTIAGDGALEVTGAVADGIASKDGLVITGGDITVTAVDDGIRGKDYLVVDDGTLDVTAGGDALKSDNDADATMGYVSVAAGAISLDAGGDAVDASTDVIVTGGELAVRSGGGAGGGIDTAVSTDGAADTAVSTKGLKGTVSVTVAGGTVAADSADDAVHSNGAIVISGGALTLASGDDGVHADAVLAVSGGAVTVRESYEGLESAVVTISDGDVDITASDDGINVAGGTDGSGQAAPGQPGDGSAAGGGQGADQFATDGDYLLAISGGTIVVDAGGDGLDSNGALEVTGGTTVVSGPTNDGNGAIDATTATADGGVLVAGGSAGMAMSPSGQAGVAAQFASALPAGTVVLVATTDGDVVAAFTTLKATATLVLSSPELVDGQEYTVYTGGAMTVTVGSYGTDGDLTGATSLGTVTATTAGSGGGMP